MKSARAGANTGARSASVAEAGLEQYRKKRDFKRTPEPAPSEAPESREGFSFVVQKHAARRLHYDFRLELNGVLKSWAVTKGPSLDPADKRLAVYVEDHPLKYGSFEGVIPKGQYGGGTVMIWDRGRWEPEGDPEKAYAKGKLSFRLFGNRLQGRWTLARMGGRAAREEGYKNWLMIKSKDEWARPDEGDLLVEDNDARSVVSQRTMAEIAKAADRVWTSEGEVSPSEVPKQTGSTEARKPPTWPSISPRSVRPCRSCQNSYRPNSRPSSTSRRRAKTGCTKSNSTATGHSAGSRTATHGCAPAPASTGRSGSHRSPMPPPACRLAAPFSMARSSRCSPRASPASRCCRKH